MVQGHYIHCALSVLITSAPFRSSGIRSWRVRTLDLVCIPLACQGIGVTDPGGRATRVSLSERIPLKTGCWLLDVHVKKSGPAETLCFSPGF